MTSKTIKKILTETYGISNPLDRWLKLSDILAIIYISKDINIYINDEELYYFDSESELMYISKSGSYKKLEASDVKSDLESYDVVFQLCFENIGGFINTSINGPYGVYLTRRF